MFIFILPKSILQFSFFLHLSDHWHPPFFTFCKQNCNFLGIARAPNVGITPSFPPCNQRLGHRLPFAPSKVGLCGSLLQRIGRVECHLSEVSGLPSRRSSVSTPSLREGIWREVLGWKFGEDHDLYFMPRSEQIQWFPEKLAIVFFSIKGVCYVGSVSQGFSLDVPILLLWPLNKQKNALCQVGVGQIRRRTPEIFPEKFWL